jgi:hypothetical protein
MENKDKIWLATHLGDKAYYKGLKRAFFDDSRAMDLLDSNINDMPHELAMNIMRAWYKGWDAANVEHNAPEPEGYKLKQL